MLAKKSPFNNYLSQERYLPFGSRLLTNDNYFGYYISAVKVVGELANSYQLEYCIRSYFKDSI